MKKRNNRELDDLIEEITVDAYGEEEQLWAFRQALEDNLTFPCTATVIGEPVKVTKIDYDGNARRGLTANCRRADGVKHVVGVADLIMASGSTHEKYLAAYRQWMGIEPQLASPRPRKSASKRAPKTSQQRVAPNSTPIGDQIEVAVLAVMQKTAHCRFLQSDETVTLRAGRLWDIVPGEIVSVKAGKRRVYGGNPTISGTIESKRFDFKALRLVPLGLEEFGLWDPAEEYWGEPGEPIDPWLKPILARGARRQFEMEQVIPGEDPEQPLDDPIIEANDLKDSGDFHGAHDMLMSLCRADLRCLDAHAHLGNLSFDSRPKVAIRHYEAGVRIGELSLGDSFDGVLPWGLIDNRPFLRCLHGFGLSLWRLGKFEESASVLGRMLWLNPSDNQGVRFEIGPVRAHRKWEAER